MSGAPRSFAWMLRLPVLTVSCCYSLQNSNVCFIGLAVYGHCTCPFDIAARFMPHTMCNLDVLLSLCVAFVLSVMKLMTQYYSFYNLHDVVAVCYVRIGLFLCIAPNPNMSFYTNIRYTGYMFSYIGGYIFLHSLFNTVMKSSFTPSRRPQ